MTGFAQFVDKGLDEKRLADARVAADQRHLAPARLRETPMLRQQVQFAALPEQGAARLGPGRLEQTFGVAGADNAPGGDRIGNTLQFMMAQLGEIEGGADEAPVSPSMTS